MRIFVHFIILSSTSSFGIPYFSPYIPFTHEPKNSDTYYMNPVWKREKRNKVLNTKKPNLEEHISMKWRKNGK